jgi:hypothetical protein
MKLYKFIIHFRQGSEIVFAGTTEEAAILARAKRIQQGNEHCPITDAFREDNGKIENVLWEYMANIVADSGNFNDNKLTELMAENSRRLRAERAARKWSEDVITDKWLGISQGAGKALRAAMDNAANNPK